jgi:hypothetical protein
MIDRSLGKASAKAPNLKLAFSLNGRPVLVDRIETFVVPHGIVAKTEIERCVSALERIMHQKGEDGREIERVIRKLVTSEKLDLASLCDFLDTALMFSDKLSRPVLWIEAISDHISTREASHSRRSLRAFQLFEEARSSQGTDREQILIKSLESGV